MEILALINSYLIYVYIFLGIIVLGFLISLTKNFNRLSKHIDQNIKRANEMQVTFKKTVDEYKTKINEQVSAFKKALLLFLFIHFVRRDYKKSAKKSLVKSTFKGAKASAMSGLARNIQ